MTRQRFRQNGKSRALLDSSPNADYQTSAGRQHSMHFSQRCCPIREELEALLTKHDIKRCIGQRQIYRTALPPLDCDILVSSDRARR